MGNLAGKNFVFVFVDIQVDICVFDTCFIHICVC